MIIPKRALQTPKELSKVEFYDSVLEGDAKFHPKILKSSPFSTRTFSWPGLLHAPVKSNKLPDKNGTEVATNYFSNSK